MVLDQQSRCDVAIIGGGVVGSRVAYFVKKLSLHFAYERVEANAPYREAGIL